MGASGRRDNGVDVAALSIYLAASVVKVCHDGPAQAPAYDAGMEPYFHRTGENRFRTTTHVSGAWDPDEQHIAPALGLLTHAIELDRDRRRDDRPAVARLSFDILGVIPLGEMDVDVSVLRAGRTIELIEATLRYDGREVVVARAWLLARFDTTALQGTSFPALPSPDTMPSADMSEGWHGGFVRSIDVRRGAKEPGRTQAWVRTAHPLIGDEAVSDTARFVGLFDLANGLSPRVQTDVAFFPNVDLTAHLFRAPTGEWLGYDMRMTFGANGLGLTETIMHDTAGPFATVSQSLTVRPR